MRKEIKKNKTKKKDKGQKRYQVERDRRVKLDGDVGRLMKEKELAHV